MTLDSKAKGEATWEASLVKLGENLNVWLADALPAYMIPSGYVPVMDRPISSNVKLDRRRLRVLGSKWSLRDLQASSRQGAEPSEAEEFLTVAETRLRVLWALLPGSLDNVIGPCLNRCRCECPCQLIELLKRL